MEEIDNKTHLSQKNSNIITLARGSNKKKSIPQNAEAKQNWQKTKNKIKEAKWRVKKRRNGEREDLRRKRTCYGVLKKWNGMEDVTSD